MSNTFKDFITAARQAGREFEVVERAATHADVAAGAHAVGCEVAAEEVEAHASRELTDEETARAVAGAGLATPRPWPSLHSNLAVFP